MYPADILPMPESVSPDEYALYLSLPESSVRLFKEIERPVVWDLAVFQMKADFRVAFLVLQAESLQVRVVIPLCDEKSRLWIDHCVMQSRITCFIAEQDSSRYRRFDSLLILPDAESLLNSVFQCSTASAFEMLLAISSSLRSIAEPASVPSYIPDTAVEQVNVYIVRDFFNIDECLEAMEEFKRPR